MNCEALTSLCAETEALADTLKAIAETIKEGLEQYPAGSPERSRTKEVVFGSSKLLERVKRLERCVTNVLRPDVTKRLI